MAIATERAAREILQRFGIDPVKVLHAAACLVQQQRPSVVAHNALSDVEITLLRGAGAHGVDQFNEVAAGRSLATLLGEFAELTVSALSLAETTKRIGVTPARVRELLRIGGLYAVDAANGRGRVFPLFQFGERETIPHLEKVLIAIGRNRHPVAVRRFFITPHPDLVVDAMSGALSPREWLLLGYDPVAVITLAKDL